ncbi:MAG TPA: glycosyl transferase family 1, partial [Flavobacteriales bacterium]|nr:glycosyl transferase family 1 [Flavobacteriales bacterium]
DASSPVVIGWSGSLTTIKHFRIAVPVLKKLREHYGDRIRFKVIGHAGFSEEELGIRGTAWSSERELEELQEIDIGIMPLPDDEWSKGKCGLKGLVYMSIGIPSVMSPVGVNTQIIRHGENGFLAGTEAEWFEILSLLIESPELRKQIGSSGRQTVVENYSVLANRENYLNILGKSS